MPSIRVLLLTSVLLSYSTFVDKLPLSMTPQVLEFAKDWWLPRHEQKLFEISKRNKEINVVFIGDSITHAWENAGKAAWEKYFEPLGALNLGFSGDRTENVLWRIEQGEIDTISPKLVVLLIGTNNTGHRKDPADETALGIMQILDEIHLRLPEANILLHAIMPRAKRPTNPLRKINDQVNAQIKQLANRDYVFWIDAKELFIDENGILDEQTMSDFLHPNANQYEKWALLLKPHIDNLIAN